MAVYRQLIALGHLSVEHKHGSLKLTDIGWEVCRGNAKVQLSVWQALKSSVARTKSDSGAAWRKRKADTNFSDPADQALYDVLRDHRAYLAKSNAVPAYVIFGNKSLVDMVERKPKNEDEMEEVFGLGKAKMRTYGRQFLGVIKNFKYKGDGI